MEELIRSKRNNCVLVALKDVSGKTDAEIFAAVRKHGYRDDRGMYTENYHRAAADLGLFLGSERHYWDLACVAGSTGPRHITVRQCVKMFPKGAYFLKTRGHVFVLRDGIVSDPNWAHRGGMARKVFSVTEILNPHVPEVKGLVCLVRPMVRRRTPGARERWAKVLRFFERVPTWECTPERLLRETGYRKLDFDWDLKRGHLKIV